MRDAKTYTAGLGKSRFFGDSTVNTQIKVEKIRFPEASGLKNLA